MEETDTQQDITEQSGMGDNGLTQDPLLYSVLSREGHERFCASRKTTQSSASTQEKGSIDDDYEVVEVDTAEPSETIDGGQEELETVGKDSGEPKKTVIGEGQNNGENESFSVLATALGFGSEFNRDVRQAAKVDYFASVLRFTNDVCEMDLEHSNVVLSLCTSILDGVVKGTPKEEIIKIVKSVMLPRMGQNQTLVNFSNDDIKKITDFAVSGVLRHRTLYKLVFDVDALQSENYHEVLIEQPFITLPMSTALTQAQWDRKCYEEKKAQEEAEASVARAAAQEAMMKAAEAARAAEEAEEAARKAALEKKPATLEEAVERLVLQRLEEVKIKLTEEHKMREEELLERISVLENNQRGDDVVQSP